MLSHAFFHPEKRISNGRISLKRDRSLCLRKFLTILSHLFFKYIYKAIEKSGGEGDNRTSPVKPQLIYTVSPMGGRASQEAAGACVSAGV